MTANVGRIDRVLRAALGAMLLSMVLLYDQSVIPAPFFRIGAGVIGLVMVSTALLRICPLYTVFGIRTCRR